MIKLTPQKYTAWKVSKYGFISGPYFPVFGLPVFGLDTGKYGPEITPYLDTFHVKAHPFKDVITSNENFK